MFSWNWKKEILTVPNLLSLFRLVLIPIYVRMYLRAETPAEYFLAGSVMAASCLTDLLDGKIARHFHMVSHVGMVLDPLADKLTQLSLMLCLASRYPLLYPVLALFVVKELFQLFAVVLCFRRGKALPGALNVGKLCTAVLFITLIMLVLFPQADPFLAEIMVLTDGFLLLLSFTCYFLAYFGKNPRIQDLE